MGDRVGRWVAESQITASRPPLVTAVAWWTAVTGLLGFFVAPFFIPWRWGPFGPPSLAVAAALAATIVCFAGAVTHGLLRARLWAWFAAWSTALAILGLRVFWIAERVDSGLELLPTALSSFPSLYVTVYAAVVPLVLATRRTRRWFFLARQLRSMSRERLEAHMEAASVPFGMRD